MLDLLSKLGKIVFENALDSIEARGYIVGLLAWLECLAPFRDLASDAMLTRCLPVALLLSAIAFCAGKVDAIALASAARVGFGIIAR